MGVKFATVGRDHVYETPQFGNEDVGTERRDTRAQSMDGLAGYTGQDTQSNNLTN